jgi:hypothetical protein
VLPALTSRRRSPIAPTLADRLLGVSRRRRQAAYLAIGGGMKLLQPMLRRIGVLLAVAVLAPLISIWVRLVL